LSVAAILGDFAARFGVFGGGVERWKMGGFWGAFSLYLYLRDNWRKF
jgi:hypothetical protein